MAKATQTFDISDEERESDVSERGYFRKEYFGMPGFGDFFLRPFRAGLLVTFNANIVS
jgi:hypothetical protein